MSNYLTAASIDELSRNPESGIIDVQLKVLTTHGDQRGFFREIFRFDEPIFLEGRFAQWSHSSMAKDVVKAWHYHHVQYDWWYVPIGCIETALIDFREESATFRRKLVFRMGEEDTERNVLPIVVRIPPGVLHGCRVISDSAHLFYITSESYNPDEEGRYPFNSPEVDHDWGEGAIVVERDTKRFVPRNTRRIRASHSTS